LLEIKIKKFTKIKYKKTETCFISASCNISRFHLKLKKKLVKAKNTVKNIVGLT